VARGHGHQQRGADTGGLDRLSKQTEANKFHIEFPVFKNDVLLGETSRRIEDLVSP
jgi:hypothetical protein